MGKEQGLVGVVPISALPSSASVCSRFGQAHATSRAPSNGRPATKLRRKSLPTTMPNKAMSAEERVEHWNRRAEEIRLKALCKEICEHLKTHPEHLAPVASKLRSMGVQFTCDKRGDIEGSTPSKGDHGGTAETVFMQGGKTIEQQNFASLRKALVALDPKYCADVHLKACKEGRARDINKDGVLKILELVTKMRRSYVVPQEMSDEEAFMTFLKGQYDEGGKLLRKIRLPVDYPTDGSFNVESDKSGTLWLNSLEFGTKLPLADIADVTSIANCDQLKFEENWTANAVLVLPNGLRLECRTFGCRLTVTL